MDAQEPAGPALHEEDRYLCSESAGVGYTGAGDECFHELPQTSGGEKVAVMPGALFYTDGGGSGTFRLNFSNTHPERVKEGMGRLARVVRAIV